MFPSHVFSNHKPPILVMTTLSKHFLYSIILSKTCESRNFDGFTMKNGSFKAIVHAIRGMLVLLVQRKTETGERCSEKGGRKTKCLWLKFFVKWVDFGIFGADD